MGRVLVALCYVWATIVDQGVGAFGKLGGGNATQIGREVEQDDHTNQSANGSDGTAGAGNRSFEWWSFAGSNFTRMRRRATLVGSAHRTTKAG